MVAIKHPPESDTIRVQIRTCRISTEIHETAAEAIITAQLESMEKIRRLERGEGLRHEEISHTGDI